MHEHYPQPPPDDSPTDPEGLPPAQPYDRITVGMDYAAEVRREIDDVTAKYISGIVPAASDSATRTLHHTGQIQSERLQLEMHHEGTRKGISDFELRMINALGTYAAVRGDRPPVEGWADLA